MRSVSTATAFLHFTTVVQSEALILYYVPYLTERERGEGKRRHEFAEWHVA